MENKNIAEVYKAREHDVSGLDPVEAEKVLEQGTVSAYKKIEQSVVGAYKKVESGAVKAYETVEDFCVEKLFAKDGESVEDAKKRLRGE